MAFPRIIIAGTNSGAGKTTFTLGLLKALHDKGIAVQPFKTGPDYIDPMHHFEACGVQSYNLDSFMLARDAALELFTRHAIDAQISVIEGVMGLYDGIADMETGSTAHLSKIIKAPVILVINARSMSTSSAAIALGFREFDRDVNIAGALLNNTGSQRHYENVKSAIEKKTGIPVLGHLPKNADLTLPERHLGLIPAPEMGINSDYYERLGGLIAQNVDIERILKIAKSAGDVPKFNESIFNSNDIKIPVRIAVAVDKAFNFYYQDNLEILKHLGAELIAFSPMDDSALTERIDGIYIGGGFPEVFAQKLSANARLKNEILKLAESGMPVYAECGGLMYLMERLIDCSGEAHDMVGIFKGAVSMTGRLQTFGYVNVKATKENILFRKGETARAHIFHYSKLNTPEIYDMSFRLTKNNGSEFYDGLTRKRVLAGYTHIHFAANLELARNFIKNCRDYRAQNG